MRTYSEKDIEMIAWWKDNDRITASVKNNWLELFDWAEKNDGLPWQFYSSAGKWVPTKYPAFLLSKAYRVDPAFEIPKPQNDCEILLVETWNGIYSFSIDGEQHLLHEAISFEGFAGILWVDEVTKREIWNFSPVGVATKDLNSMHFMTEDHEQWERACRPARVKFMK